MQKILSLLLALVLVFSLLSLTALASDEDEDILSALGELATQLRDKGRDALEDIAARWRERDSKELAQTLREFLSDAETMTDEELSSEIRRLGQEHGVSFTDDQCAQLVSLCRRLQKLEDWELEEKAEDLKNLLKKLGDLGDKTDGIKGAAASVFAALRRFWDKFTLFVSDLLVKK